LNKLLVASEYTEPGFYVDRVCEGLQRELDSGHRCGLLLITKNLEMSLPIIDYATNVGVTVLTHVTITGLSGTVLEPSTPGWEDTCSKFRLLSGPTVLRVDPLIPGITDFHTIEQIVRRAGECGITRCRTSVIDYYPFVRDKFQKEGLPYSNSFQPPLNVRIEVLSNLFCICETYGMFLESCAENIDLPGLLKVGCASCHEWRALGLDLPSGVPKRRECFCNITKYDLLRHEPNCPNNCLYCYWGKFR